MEADVTDESRYSESLTLAKLRVVAHSLGLNAEALAELDLIEAILDLPDGDRLLIAADRSIPRVLEALYEGLAREDGYLDHGDGWIAFNAEDAYIEAELKRGQDPFNVIRIDAYLLSVDDTRSTEAEVAEWITQQPRPVLGILTTGSRNREDGTLEYLPMLTVELRPDGVMSEFVEELLSPFAEAWDNRSVAEGTEHLDFGPDGHPYRVRDAVEIEPRNAWLLIGDDASFPSSQVLDDMRLEAQAGVYENEWTAPMNGAQGDLVLIYFMGPRKAAHFVARLASLPFWDSETEVNALNAVDRHQWWAYTTSLIEIEPIPFKALQKAGDGFLILKGRSGKYLCPDTIGSLTFTAKIPEQQAELDLVARRPKGDARLPDRTTMTVEEWTKIPSGLLPLEAKVSEYIVEPLANFIASAPHWVGTSLTMKREHAVPNGSVDFLMTMGKVEMAAVEVKLAVRRPASGVWTDSPDFRQLRRYMDQLELPGILIDAQSIFLVDPGADSPHQEIVRSDATLGVIDQIGVFVQTHAAHNVGNPVQSSLSIFMAYLPVWDTSPGLDPLQKRPIKQVPVVVLRALSAESPAVEALPIIDSPALRKMAEKFLSDEACGTVAEVHLGGSLMDPHAVATILGIPLPEERPELLQMLGNLYAPRQLAKRRVARRG